MAAAESRCFCDEAEQGPEERQRMIVPYRVDVPFNHTPVLNYLLIASIILAFFMQFSAIIENADPETGRWPESVERFVLQGFKPAGLLGHMWLHGGLFHLLGNMLFLWVFGNAVCSKLGNLYYIPAYLLVGLIAAFTHLIFDGGPAIGASGAINGVVGMYLIFFPENSVSCFFLLFYRPIFFNWRGIWLVLLFFAFDVYGAYSGGGNVAYFAHIGGFLSGAAIAVIMLKTKLITMERDEKSLLQMLGIDKVHTYDHTWSRDDLSNFGDYTGGKSKTDRTPPASALPGARRVDTPGSSVRPLDVYIRFQCPCGRKVKIGAEHAGRVGRCPQCHARLKIPDLL